MKRMILAIFAVLAAALLCAALTSCFAGAENDRENAGERDGVVFDYLEDQKLLLLSGKAALKKSNRIFSLLRDRPVEGVWLSKDLSVDDGATFDGFATLTDICFEAAEDEVTVGFDGRFRTHYGVTDLETNSAIPGFPPLGHCPVAVTGRCAICGRSFVLQYENTVCSLIRDGKKVYDETLVIDGRKVRFDENGVLRAEGFVTLGGETRFYENDRYAVGTRDIDGVRYTFSSEGALTSRRTLDTSIPPYQIILPILMIPVGVGVCFAVYKLFLYRERKEEEKE